MSAAVAILEESPKVESINRVTAIMRLEKEGDDCQWQAAELIAAELAETGKSARKLGNEIGKSHTHVSRMRRTWDEYKDTDPAKRPPFAEAYAGFKASAKATDDQEAPEEGGNPGFQADEATEDEGHTDAADLGKDWAESIKSLRKVRRNHKGDADADLAMARSLIAEVRQCITDGGFGDLKKAVKALEEALKAVTETE